VRQKGQCNKKGQSPFNLTALLCSRLLLPSVTRHKISHEGTKTRRFQNGVLAKIILSLLFIQRLFLDSLIFLLRWGRVISQDTLIATARFKIAHASGTSTGAGANIGATTTYHCILRHFLDSLIFLLRCRKVMLQNAHMATARFKIVHAFGTSTGAGANRHGARRRLTIVFCVFF
jgi:hypothetical protein